MPASFDNDITAALNALVTSIGSFTDPNGGSVTASRTISSDGLTDAQLPYVWVRDGRQLDRAELSTDLYADDYQFQALIYVTRLTDGEFDDETSFDNSRNWVKPFHKYLAQNRAVTEAAYILINDVRDTGAISLFTKQSIRYAGVAFTIPIRLHTRF